MPVRSYQQPGLNLAENGDDATPLQVHELQIDLRQLGYLARGLDGSFGSKTTSGVMALQHDLLNNHGSSTGGDGQAPVSVADYNQGRVMDVTGIVDQNLARCISDMLDDPQFPSLPRAANAVEENGKIVPLLMGIANPAAPVPFLLGVLSQESDLKHYNEPRPGDSDTFIVLGLDKNATEKFIVTSRGYGAGQFTLFHHPPRPEEVATYLTDVRKNVSAAIGELREKFDKFIIGPSSGLQADDRLAEIGSGPLRLCKFATTDPRYFRDCQQCLKDAGAVNIQAGITPLYPGSTSKYQPTQYYATASYPNVPNRARVGCDWPYAIRRYNGSGINSFHYQIRVIRKIQKLALS